MFRAPSLKLIWTLRALCAVALAVSSYLTWVAFTKSDIAGCGGQVFDCDHVLASKWSIWFSIPVALGAVGLYLAGLGSLAFCRQTVSDRWQQHGWRAFTVLGFSAGLAACWFISLQVFVIGHLCLWCLTAHGCGLVIASLLLWSHPLGLVSTARLSGFSAAGVLVLIGGQLLTPAPPTYVVEYHVDEPVESDSNAVEVSGDMEDGLFEAPGFDDEEDVFAPPVLEEEDAPVEQAEVAGLENS